MVTLFLFFAFQAKSQDPTVYVSPHNVEATLSNIYFSIDKGGHKYITTNSVKSQSSENGEFSGKVELVEFQMKDFNKIMSCEPTIALEMPMKIMVWEEDGDVYIAYISPFVFKRRYFVSGCDDLLSGINKSMIRIINDAIRTH